MPPDSRPRPGRRTLLAALATAPTGVLVGCGIRLEDDAPRVPLVPARTPVPAEDLLVGLVRDCLRLAAIADGLDDAVGADLATLHRRQAEVLGAALRAGGVPAEDLAPRSGPSESPTPSASPTTTPSGSASASPSPSASASVDPARATLARAERTAADGAGRFAGVQDDLRAPVAALHAQRSAAAGLLGLPASEPTADTLAGLGPAASVVGRFGSELDAADYFLEVVQARVAGTLRTRAAGTRASLAVVRREVGAAAAVDAPALGHPLPFPVATAEDAVRLARETLTAVREAAGAMLEPLVAEVGADGLVVAARWVGTVEIEAHRWGVPLAPFPGLT